jgi:hypothetical protein
MIYDDNFCQFIPQEDNSLQCNNCGLKIRIPEGGRIPIFPCSKSLIRKPQDDGPSFATKIKNFASSVADHVAKGLPQCTDEQIIKRHDICSACERFKDNTCLECGCPLLRNKHFVSKLSWADQECPIGKWGKEI